jgi:hypothetical protein
MSSSYCPSCYRDLSSNGLCAPCEEHRYRTRPAARLSLWIGAAGLPMLLFGMLALNSRITQAGAILAGCGAIVYTIVALRGAAADR